MVVEKVTQTGRRDTTVAAALFERGDVFITGEITQESAMDAVQQLLYLGEDSREVRLHINSPGGSVSSGLAIVDAIERLKQEGVVVSTVAWGLAASMAAVLLAAGSPGHRAVCTNAEVMIHQVLGGAQGQATDIEIQAAHIRQVKEKMNRLLASYCGQSLERVRGDTERDHYLTAPEAIIYGLADFVYGERTTP